jgi:arginase
MRPIQIIGVASGLGAQDQGCADGPEALRAGGLLTRLQAAGLRANWQETLRPLAAPDPTQAITALCTRLSQTIYNSIEAGNFPLVIGGDHSSAVGTWSGLHRALGNQRLGLIWIDAHMDSHTPQTSPSGALHGMPLACLLGYGLPALTAIGGPPPQLLPQHVCLIGVRSFEPGEAALLEQLQVRVFPMDEIHKRGIDAVIGDALPIVLQGTAGFGISIDLDALDPREEPGVGSPVADGLLGQELLSGLKRLRRHPALLGLELMEYNPHRDFEQRTANMALDLAECLLGPK